MLLEVSSSLGIDLNGRLGEITSRKLQEIAKEEKLAWDRLKDMRSQTSKRFKDLSSSGVFG